MSVRLKRLLLVMMLIAACIAADQPDDSAMADSRTNINSEKSIEADSRKVDSSTPVFGQDKSRELSQLGNKFDINVENGRKRSKPIHLEKLLQYYPAVFIEDFLYKRMNDKKQFGRKFKYDPALILMGLGKRDFNSDPEKKLRILENQETNNNPALKLKGFGKRIFSSNSADRPLTLDSGNSKFDPGFKLMGLGKRESMYDPALKYMGLGKRDDKPELQPAGIEKKDFKYDPAMKFLGLGKRDYELDPALKYMGLGKRDFEYDPALKYMGLGKRGSQFDPALKYMGLGKRGSQFDPALKYMGLGKRGSQFDPALKYMGLGKRGSQFDPALKYMGLGKRGSQFDPALKYMGLGKRGSQFDPALKYMGLGKRGSQFDPALKYMGLGKRGSEFDPALKYMGLGKRRGQFDPALKYMGLGKRDGQFDPALKYMGLGKRGSQFDPALKYMGLGKRGSQFDPALKYMGLGKRGSQFDPALKYMGLGKRGSQFDPALKYMGLGKRGSRFDPALKYMGLGKRNNQFDSALKFMVLEKRESQFDPALKYMGLGKRDYNFDSLKKNDGLDREKKIGHKIDNFSDYAQDEFVTIRDDSNFDDTVHTNRADNDNYSFYSDPHSTASAKSENHKKTEKLNYNIHSEQKNLYFPNPNLRYNSSMSSEVSGKEEMDHGRVNYDKDLLSDVLSVRKRSTEIPSNPEKTPSRHNSKNSGSGKKNSYQKDINMNSLEKSRTSKDISVEVKRNDNAANTENNSSFLDFEHSKSATNSVKTHAAIDLKMARWEDCDEDCLVKKRSKRYVFDDLLEAPEIVQKASEPRDLETESSELKGYNNLPESSWVDKYHRHHKVKKDWERRPKYNPGWIFIGLGKRIPLKEKNDPSFKMIELERRDYRFQVMDDTDPRSINVLQDFNKALSERIPMNNNLNIEDQNTHKNMIDQSMVKYYEQEKSKKYDPPDASSIYMPEGLDDRNYQRYPHSSELISASIAI